MNYGQIIKTLDIDEIIKYDEILKLLGKRLCLILFSGYLAVYQFKMYHIINSS
jgi:hypothetical protein